MWHSAKLAQGVNGVQREAWLEHHEDGGLSLALFEGRTFEEQLTIIVPRESLPHLAFILLKERLSGNADAGDELRDLLHENAIPFHEIGTDEVLSGSG